MDIQGISSLASSLLTPSSELIRTTESGSTILRELEKVQSGESDTDGLSFRLKALGFSHARLMETHREVRIEQAQKTVAQTALQALNSIQAELTEIQTIANAISEGQFTQDQLQDLQIMIESRLARIDDIASGAQFSGTELLTGNTVRITTDPITDEGFEVTYPVMDSSSLGLDAYDVVNADISTAIEIIGEAATTLESAISDVETEIGIIDTILTETSGKLETRFSELQASERLNIPGETRWLTQGKIESLISTGDLQTVLSSVELDASVVSSLLA